MSVIAATDLGALAGEEHDGVAVFRHVPYAAPPVGELRFAAPAPVETWEGICNATRHGPVAPQPPSRLRAAMGDFERPQHEDCLTLTIATPGADDGERPVVVWLHGGAYMTGAGSLDWYDGSVLARDGECVVVGVNYRLGALGFLHHPAIGAANCGLLDMIAALEWVRDQIAAFGGDPARVTLMGQSAGAHAIMCLLTMPQAEGLFARAILQSAPPMMAPLGSAAATAHARSLLDALDISADAPDVAARLRAETAARLMEAQMRVVRGGARFADISPPFVPAFDGLDSSAAFVAAAARGAAARGIDVVIGTTREEMHAFFAPDPAMADPDPAAVAERFATLAGRAAAIESYRLRRPGGSTAELLGDLVTDHLFLLPSLALADALSEAGGRVWVYRFDWAAPGNRFKACHCIELPFVFGTARSWANAAMLEGADPAQMSALAGTMRDAWTAFAREGDPTGDELPWPLYRPQDRLTMCFGEVVGAMGDPAGISWRGGFKP